MHRKCVRARALELESFLCSGSFNGKSVEHKVIGRMECDDPIGMVLYFFVVRLQFSIWKLRRPEILHISNT